MEESNCRGIRYPTKNSRNKRRRLIQSSCLSSMRHTANSHWLSILHMDPAWGRGSQWTEGGGPRCSRRVCLGDSAVPGCSVWPEGAWRRVRTPPVLWGHLSSCLPNRMEIIIVIIIHRGQFCGSICGSSKLRRSW
ncbi:uncharacterized protein LOC129654589 isoform X3 [Bubalus kerabau]|uniref:uncharacterized protein LOC129654589 isoform X3 n=1 Tax=Bubalus carabanensis TaxID=3119969 RepID=UPI00244EB8DC|nr:uncharacterized protein LOC129654589 isoform X3 [Bubalus carabanensis]